MLPFGGAGLLNIGKKVVGGTNGALLITSAAGKLASLADVATGSIVVSGGVGAIPAYSAAPTLTTSLTVPTVLGGTGVSGNLILQSTSSATRGTVQTADLVKIATANQAFGATNPIYCDVGTGTATVTTGAITAVRYAQTVTIGGNSAISIASLFNAAGTLKDDGTARAIGPALILASQFTYTATVAGVTAVDFAGIPAYTTVYHSPTLNRTGAGTGTLTTMAGLYVSGLANIGVGWTVTNYYGLLCDAPTIGGTVTNIAVVKSTLAAGTNRFFLQDTGGAQSQFAGLFTKYNNIATVSNGVPSELATIDSTAQTANIGSTLLYNVPASGAGMYRVSVLVVETTAGSVSSTLPNAQIVYTDNETGGSITIDATPVLGVAGIGQTGALTSNTVGTTSSGVIVINAKASTAINYQTVNYASTAAGMAYALHIKLEAL